MSKEEAFVLLTRTGDFEVDAEGQIWRLVDRRRRTPLPERKRAEGRHKGYLKVEATFNGRRRYILAHRVVWTWFHGPIPDDLTVNHKDGRKHNNHPDNLELITQAEQMRHAVEVLCLPLGHSSKGSSNWNAKLNDELVCRILSDHSAGIRVNELARRYGVCHGQISRIVRRKNWSHVAAG